MSCFKKKVCKQTIILAYLIETGVSKSHGLLVVRPRKKILTLRKIWRLLCTDYKCMHFNLFYSFFFILHTYYVIFSEIFYFFLHKILKPKY